MTKEARTSEQQVTLLQARNMLFNDIPRANTCLKNISYYRLAGYWWDMQDDSTAHHFREDSSFKTVLDRYDFDRKLRLLIFDAIERIEIALRTKIIYYLSLSYGGLWYLDSNLFQRDDHHRDFKERLNENIEYSQETFILEHKKNHPNEAPESWKALEVISFGTLSKLYKNLKHQLPEKAIIANKFGLNNQKYLSSWLNSVSVLRNIIAHHGRLYNRNIVNRCYWPPKTGQKILDYNPLQNGPLKIYPILSAIIYLCDNIGLEQHLREDIKTLIYTFPELKLKTMGFPENWDEQPIWKHRT